MKMKRNPFIILFLIAWTLPSCDFLESEPHIIAEDTFYDSKESAQLALNGVYGVLNSYPVYGANLILNFNYTDDLCHFMSPGGSAVTEKGATFEHDANNAQLYDTWTWLYKGVRNANAFLERIEGTGFDEDGSMTAQAIFLRAYYYFILAQNFYNVPLRLESTRTYAEVKCKATPQYDVMVWAASQMEESLENMTGSLEHSPSDINKSIVHGILARVYLYMAGASVASPADKKPEYYMLARDHAKAVIDSGLHRLNPDYKQIFINYISDTYDHEYYESMWEADFIGDRSSPDYWSDGRWGDLNGLRSSSMGTEYTLNNANFAYGLYCNTLKIWDLYMSDDRTVFERNLSHVTDSRQDWNLPPYHYNGFTDNANRLYPYGGDPSDIRMLVAGIDKTPYIMGNAILGTDTNKDETCYPAGRYIGKFRRECEYEGRKLFKGIWNGINMPLLRYADVLLMYAEAVNEVNGAPDESLYDIVKQIRDRAGIQTLPYAGNYDTKETFLKFIQNERGRELCFEGIRRYDLLRWGIYFSSLKEVSQLTSDPRWPSGIASTYNRIYERVSEKHQYLPIPTLELAVNSEMRQNPLW